MSLAAARRCATWRGHVYEGGSHVPRDAQKAGQNSDTVGPRDARRTARADPHCDTGASGLESRYDLRSLERESSSRYK